MQANAILPSGESGLTQTTHNIMRLFAAPKGTSIEIISHKKFTPQEIECMVCDIGKKTDENEYENELRNLMIIKAFSQYLNANYRESKDQENVKNRLGRLGYWLGLALVTIGDIGMSEIAPFVGFLLILYPLTHLFLMSCLIATFFCLIDLIVNYSILSKIMDEMFKDDPNKNISYLDIILKELEIVNEINDVIVASPKKMAEVENDLFNKYADLAIKINTHIAEYKILPYKGTIWRDLIMIGILVGFSLLTAASAYFMISGFLNTVLGITSISSTPIGVWFLFGGGGLLIAGKLVTRCHSVYQMLHPEEKKTKSIEEKLEKFKGEKNKSEDLVFLKTQRYRFFVNTSEHHNVDSTVSSSLKAIPFSAAP